MSAPAPLSGCDQPLAEAFDCVLLDLDGVCFQGTAPVPYAAEAIASVREVGMKVGFVTNNASRTREQVVAHLRGVGIAAAPGEVMTSSDAIASLMEVELPVGSPVLVVGADGLFEAVRSHGMRPVSSASQNPVAVVQGYGASVGWPELAEATYAINGGAQFYAANLDLTLPTERGFAPGNGSLVAAVTAATGRVPVAAGKPAPGIFHAAARQCGATNPLVVGDRLDTDIEGATNAGLASLFVLTGVNNAVDLACSPARRRPTFLADDLRGLLRAHLAATASGDRATCGEASAEWNGGVLHVSGSDTTHRACAACAATWPMIDRGASVARDNLAAWMTP